MMWRLTRETRLQLFCTAFRKRYQVIHTKSFKSSPQYHRLSEKTSQNAIHHLIGLNGTIGLCGVDGSIRILHPKVSHWFIALQSLTPGDHCPPSGRNLLAFHVNRTRVTWCSSCHSTGFNNRTANESMSDLCSQHVELLTPENPYWMTCSWRSPRSNN
jgi:hypothetical protein